MLSVLPVKESFIFLPHIEVRGFSSPLSDVVVENLRLLQKDDSSGHHHGVRDFLAYCYREFPILFQIFN